MTMSKEESKDYLTKQIITYIGNKRELLNEIEKEVIFVCKELGKESLVCLDLFSGSGVVSRFLKQYSSKIIANDLEAYSKIINECFLSNKNEFNVEQFNEYLLEINKRISAKPIKGIIRKNYSPKNDKKITVDDRAFYTNENATYIDSFRYYIDEVVPERYQKYFLALLLTEASIHVNTCGVFKGFYKDHDTGIGKFGGKAENALTRIKGKIKIEAPVLSNFETEYEVYQKDANELASELHGLDLVYLDPPYNQHPYGSNYFMLNIILKNKIDGNMSKVSGIPDDWNHSIYNKKQTALNGMRDIISKLDTKYVLISYNNEGFISINEMKDMLIEFGTVKERRIQYNAFRGSRNLRERSIYTNEFLFLLKKEK
ncbi:MAG: DNA adenine methylase [Bacilli bacterium]